MSNNNIKISTELLSAKRNEYRVTLNQGEQLLGQYTVTVTAQEHSRFGSQVSVAELLAATFRFLLDRENAGSILPKFSISVVKQYFPDYPQKIDDYL